jgi:hypothetical protein
MSAAEIMRLRGALERIRAFAERQDKLMSDPNDDDGYTESRPPDGDDWNDLFDTVTQVVNQTLGDRQ